MKPILFNTEMIRAILDGRKTQTRRIVKPQPIYNDGFWELGGAGWSDRITSFSPVPAHSLWNRSKYHPGDILYVREPWGVKKSPLFDHATPVYENSVYYRADDDAPDDIKWRPSIHMPKEAARIFLRVTDVRVERLQDMTDDDAKQEGAFAHTNMSKVMHLLDFARIWNSTIKPADIDRYGWNANPWVWVYEFERCDENE